MRAAFPEARSPSPQHVGSRKFIGLHSRNADTEAIALYEACGYRRIPAYGPFVGNPSSLLREIPESPGRGSCIGRQQSMTSVLFFSALQGMLVLMLVALVVLPARVRMERRARRLLFAHPDAERKSVYLPFPSVKGKRAAMEARIAEVESGGWTFLRATEASPLRTLRSWGGGLTLHFIRAVEVGPDSPSPTRTNRPVA